MIDEKKTRRISIRLTETDYRYLLAISSMVGMTTSEYLRTLAKSSVSAAKVQEQKGVFNLEDFKTLFDD